MPLWFKILLIITLPVFAWLFFIGVVFEVAELTAVGAIILAITVIGFGFYFNYGITVSQKRIVLLYYNAFRIFRREDITRFEIGFDEDSIWGEIKAKGKKAYTFVFDDFSLSSASDLIGVTVKVKLSEEYADRAIEKLSAIENIKIHNRFS